MVVVAIVLVAHAQGLVPSQAHFLPVLKPLHLRAGLAEELHLHLLKLPHAEDKLAGDNLVTESLTYLGDTEGQLHAPCLLHVQVVDEDALSRLGTQVNLVGGIGKGTHLRGEHQVKLAHVRPVLGARYGIHDALVQYDLLQFRQVRPLHGLGITLMQSVSLGHVLQHPGIGLAELLLVESVSETLLGLGHFLVYLLVILGDLVFYQIVGAITLLGVLVVYQGIIESVHVATGFPHSGVHEDGRVYAHDVAVEQHHALPPILLDVVLELHAVLAVVIYRRQTIIDIAAGEHESVLLAVAHYLFENVVLCHI